MPPSSTANSSTIRLDDLEEDRPVLHHQHALSQVLAPPSSHARRQPTQLVYPDKSIAIGFPPLPLKPQQLVIQRHQQRRPQRDGSSANGGDVSSSNGAANDTSSSSSSSSTSGRGDVGNGGGGGADAAADDVAAAGNGTNQGDQTTNASLGQAVVYVSETPVPQVMSRLTFYGSFLLLSIAIQCSQIVSLFFGGPLISIIDVSWSSSGVIGFLQSSLYYSFVLSNVFALFGSVICSSLLLTIYGSIQMTLLVGGVAMWQKVDIDALVLFLALINRYLSFELSFYFMPHAFVVPSIQN